MCVCARMREYMHVCARAHVCMRMCVCKCVCVVGSLHCMNEIVALLNLSFIYL